MLIIISATAFYDLARIIKSFWLCNHIANYKMYCNGDNNNQERETRTD